MSFIHNNFRRILTAYKRYILRDPLEREILRWRRDKGDETLRLNYPLSKDSLVIDVGGYKGDFAAAIHDRYKCRVIIFEPVPTYFQECVDRFINQNEICVYNYGLSSTDDKLVMEIAADGSSFFNIKKNGEGVEATLCNASRIFKEMGFDSIDLLKINIEGGEFSLLKHLVDTENLSKINFLQIQFHNFFDNAPSMRETIREQLRLTHDEIWNYDFVWESWKRR